MLHRRIAIVSPYPSENGKVSSGVEHYTQRLFTSLVEENPSYDVFLVSDKAGYEPSNSRIMRVYRFGEKLYWLKIFRALLKLKPDLVHIQHEYFLYGGFLEGVFFPILVLLCRLSFKKTIVTLHQVLPIMYLRDHVFRKENGIKGSGLFLEVGLRLITAFIAYLGDAVIVHEEFQRLILVSEYRISPKKIFVKPHGIDEAVRKPKIDVRKRLGLPEKSEIIIFMGYLAGYKGLDLLLEFFERYAKEKSDAILVVAGGPHPRLANQPWYQDWLKKFNEKVDILRDKGYNIVLTGYLPDNAVDDYLSAADLMILPYRARFSASGPEALALSRDLPVYIPRINQDDRSIVEDALIFAEKPFVKKADCRTWKRLAKNYYTEFLN